MSLSDIAAVTAGKTKTTGVSPFSELELSKVYPNPNQPRKQFDDIEELAATIKEHGLLQPITVVKKEDGHMIISGERRYKAHLHNGAKTIKSHIVDVDDDEIEELALIENIQRNNLTDLEFAKGVLKRWNSGKYAKKSDLAKRLGKSESYVSKALSSLKLDDEILEDIEQNKKDIPISVMDEIARVKDKTVQKEVYDKYSAGEITRDDIKEFREPKSESWAKVNKSESEEVFIKGNFPREKIEDSFNKPSGVSVHKAKDAIPPQNGIKVNDITYTKINDIDHIVSEIKQAVKEGATLDANNFLTGGKLTGTHLDNSYEVEIFKLLKEIEELNNKEVYIVSHREKKGTAAGGGFRCRALHEYEAIEIAKQSKYKDLANDKNIIWEARTLKSHCNVSSLSDHIAYGFGTVNDMGIYIAACDGDFKGTLAFEQGGDFVKTTHNKEYQIIIKEIHSPIEKPKEQELPKNDDEPVTINLLELNQNDVYVEYSDGKTEHISYSKTKTLIKNATQEYIKYENTGSQKACDFLNALPKNITKQGVYLKKKYEF